MARKKLISVVVPCYNEEACAAELAQALRAVFARERAYAFEAILVDNGSQDRTWEELLKIRKADKRFKLLRLMRNFTADGGITAGLAHAAGDAAVIVYADLQDPPALISEFLKRWERGYLNVFGIIKARHDSPLRSFNAKIFYYVMDWLTGGLFPRNVGDFRLVDRTVYEAVNRSQERNRVLRGLFAWTGARSIGVPYERQARVAGTSKAFTSYALNFALKSIFSFSYVPIAMLTGLGFVLSAAAFSALLVWACRWWFWGLPLDGISLLGGLMLLLFGFVFMVLGVIGKYISMIDEESKGRPNFITVSKEGFGARG